MLAGVDDLMNVGGNRIKPEKENIWKVVVWLIGILALIILYVFEIKWFLRTFGMGRLAMITALLGAIVGAGLGTLVSKSARTGFDKMQIIVMVAVLGAFAMPLLASMSNRLLGSEVVNEKVEFTKLDPIMEAKFDVPTEIKPDAYFLYFVRDSQIEKLKVKEPHFLNTKRGAKVDLPVIKGLWGYDIAQLK